MNVLITGGCGFLGVRLARTLLARGELSVAGAAPRRIERIVLADRVPPPFDLRTDPRIQFCEGDLLEQALAGGLPARGSDAVFHLAAAVSGECEADFDLGMRANLGATRALLDGCRALGTAPLLVFASSVAVYGHSPEQPLPAVIDDNTLPTPQNSYGIQKFMAEQLVTDCTRKGFVRGRSVRLMTVAVRPGRPNGAASSFLSGMIREPLAGQRARVPVAPGIAVALSSPANTVAGLLRAAQASPAEWGARTAVNLPALTVTVGEMAGALERIAGRAAADLLDWHPDPLIESIVSSWPCRIRSARAQALGLSADQSFDDLILGYVRENAEAIQLQLEVVTQ